jgi:hypothetical protein
VTGPKAGSSEGDSAEPCKSFRAPFHLAIDQQDRIWVADTSDKVTRFPAADPSKAENFKTGIINSGLNIDSQGNYGSPTGLAMGCWAWPT